MISVDCKKKELIGNFRNAGREWRAKGTETKVAARGLPFPARDEQVKQD